MIPIDSIEIPERFVAICDEWYGGQGDLLYAVSSTGGLTTGSIRPMNDDGERASDEEWYYGLWAGLSVDVGRARRACQNGLDAGWDSEDIDYRATIAVLTDFEDWIDDDVLPRLAASYGLEG